MNQTFLVTGGNGYIGSHMCQYLHKQGHTVLVLDSHITSPQNPVHSYGQFFRGDISDESVVKEILNNHKVDGVFHFAARSVVSESEEFPFDYINDNSVKSTRFLKTLVEHGIKKIVFSSTSSVYGAQSDKEKLNEEVLPSPENAYALSKKLVEDNLRYLAGRFSLNVGVLRYFNVAGSDPNLEIGENHHPETHLIPNLCLSHLRSQTLKFKLFGDQHPTSDGTCVRDYIHVCDLVRAHWLTFKYFKNEKSFDVFNLGSGKGFSVLEVLKEFESVVGTKVNYEVVGARAGDPPRLVCDIQKATERLGFSNEYGLKDCIEHCFSYLRKTADAPSTN